MCAGQLLLCSSVYGAVVPTAWLLVRLGALSGVVGPPIAYLPHWHCTVKHQLALGKVARSEAS